MLQMTRADLTGAVYQAIGLPLKESDVVVCAIFDPAMDLAQAIEPKIQRAGYVREQVRVLGRSSYCNDSCTG